MLRTIITAITAAAAATLTAAPANAAAAALSWEDLDLATAAGRAELNDRIDATAREACRGEMVTGSYIRGAPTARCLADARAQIRAKLPRQALAVAGDSNSEAR